MRRRLTIVNTMAVRFPDLGAAVPFYGGQPSAADTAKIKAPLLIHYAALDERNVGRFTQALRELTDRVVERLKAERGERG